MPRFHQLLHQRLNLQDAAQRNVSFIANPVWRNRFLHLLHVRSLWDHSRIAQTRLQAAGDRYFRRCHTAEKFEHQCGIGNRFLEIDSSGDRFHGRLAKLPDQRKCAARIGIRSSGIAH